MPKVRIDLVSGKPAAYRRTMDVFIDLVEVKKEHWPFGNGEAQYT